MKRAVWLLVAVGLTAMVSVAACAAAQSHDTRARVVDEMAVLSELTQRSGLSESELKGMLADCDASQRNTYFCAYRDLVGAELELDSAVSEKLERFPRCRGSIESQRQALGRARDVGCAKAAAESFGEGSMAPTAQAVCAARATRALTARIRRMGNCSGADGRR